MNHNSANLRSKRNIRHSLQIKLNKLRSAKCSAANPYIYHLSIRKFQLGVRTIFMPLLFRFLNQVRALVEVGKLVEPNNGKLIIKEMKEG